MKTLTRREFQLALGLAAIAGLWAVFTFCVSPMLERIETLKRVIPQKQAKLELLKQKSIQYKTLQGKLSRLGTGSDSQAQDFKIVGFLESRAAELDLNDHLAHITQRVSKLDNEHRETIAEVELVDVSFGQLVKLLLKTKSSKKPLQVKNLHIRKINSGSQKLNVTMEISAVTRLQTASAGLQAKLSM